MASHPAFIDKMRLPWWPTLLFMCQSGRYWMWHAQPLQERRRTKRRGRKKVMLSITAVESPALWRRAKLLHVGVSSANFRSFPAQLNVPHEALLVIVSKFHNRHNNSETFSTNFPLKQRMNISRILTWRRQEKWNPAEYSSDHYRTFIAFTNVFYRENIPETEKQYLPIKSSDPGTGLCKMLVLHQRDPAAKLASKSPELTSGYSPRHHPCCPANRV